MANTNSPFGLRMLRGMGSNANFELDIEYIAYNDTTKIYTGDPVKRLSTGYVAQWTASTGVSQMAGIFMGCEYLSTSQGAIVQSKYWPGADVASGVQVKAKILRINYGSPIYFQVQSNATGVAFADKGQNIDLAMGTGNVYSGRSGAYLDLTTANTTATLPFTIVDLWGVGGRGNAGPGSEAGAYNWAIVTANIAQTTGI